MTPIEWFYAQGDQQLGPVSASDLKQLAASGTLQPADLVWREGMADWAEAQNIKGLFDADARIPPVAAPPAAKPATAPGIPGEVPSAPPQMPRGDEDATPLGRTRRREARLQAARHPFDMLLQTIRDQCTARLIDSAARMCVLVGHFGLYAAMIVCLIFAIIQGVKANSLNTLLMGLVAVLIIAVLQYVAARFCGALGRLNRATSAVISSTAFPDCFALLAIAAGLATMIAMVVVAIQGEAYSLILLGLLAFIVYEYLAIVSLCPEALNISVASQARAGEEAIGVISFLIKVNLQLVPVMFATGVIYGTLRIVVGCYQIFSEAGSPLPLATATAGAVMVLQSAALPILAYLLFLLYYLAVDVVRAILIVPGKLDKLAEEKESGDRRQETEEKGR
jgi:hypothetical protein